MKRCHWAVVGAPSSGKTYLLSDLIMALEAMGYRQEELPLTVQYSSLGSFFFDAGNVRTGSLQQTEIYACRRENHYGGVFRHPKKMGKLEIDFLNIPGEVFSDNNKRMAMFFELKDCISRIGNDRLVVTSFVNPSGKEQLIVEPSRAVRNMLHLNADPQPASEEAKAEYRKLRYLSWGYIFAELKADRYERGKSKAVTGKYLLQHFFDFNTDSVIQSIQDIWDTLPVKLDYFEYDANNIFTFFYPLLYCSQATDIILCDKTAAPATQSDLSKGEGKTGGYDFESLAKQLCNYIEHNNNHMPRVYLAFRGTDFILKQKAEEYAHLIKSEMPGNERRKVVYDAFIKEIQDIMTTKHSTFSPQGESEGALGFILTGMPLDQHIRTRIGNDIGHGFWHLLNKTEPRGLIARTIRSLKGSKTIQEIYSSPDRPVIPPHVFFTATPIDVDMNIYDNDQDDVTVFTTETDNNIRSFHIETACKGIESMCFGSYQLLEEILA